MNTSSFEEEQSGSGINQKANNFVRMRKEVVDSLFDGNKKENDNDIMKVDFYSTEEDKVTVYHAQSLKIHPNETSFLSRLESDTGKNL